MTAPISAQDFSGYALQPSSLTSDPTPLHDATRLTKGGNLARIALNGQIYSLRITRQGKLILTK